MTPESVNREAQIRKRDVLYAGWPRNCKKQVKAISYTRIVFFWLTASERLDRLPLVFAASSDTTIRS